MTLDERTAFVNVVSLLQTIQQRALSLASTLEAALEAIDPSQHDALRAVIEGTRAQAVDVSSIIASARAFLES